MHSLSSAQAVRWFVFFCLLSAVSISATQVRAQACAPGGNPATYGNNSWIGYVYDGANNFNTNYLGSFTQSQNFDQSFCGDDCNFTIHTGCAVQTETFSVRFRMALTISAADCGTYPITIGGDDGVRLSIDGGATWEINTLYFDHPYQETTQTVYLGAGTHNLVLEYYENGGQNRVRFNRGARNGFTTGGRIGSDQTLCQVTIDPALLTDVFSARNCDGDPVAYRWQISSDNVNFTSITPASSANGATYDPPSQPVGTRYYRRRAIIDGVTVYSNTVTVTANSLQGDQVTYGNGNWIGYVYDGVANFSTNYHGYFNIATPTFDYSFCGDNCTTTPINGCPFQTETFTVRFRMRFTPPADAGYTFTIGADDGVRLSVNGGSTFVLSDWSDHGYREVTSGVVNLFAANTYDFVLEYYENGGGNRVRFSYTTGPLPVTWAFLDGYHASGSNVLDWKTASEKNNAGFQVDRSADGVKFDSLGFIDGNGTTQAAQTYTFTDATPAPGWNYYRLKQIDYDGRFEYSKVIPVFVNARGRAGIYPNPAHGSVYISHAGARSAENVTIRHILTNRMILLKRDEQQPARYPLEGAPPGTYVISFTIEGRRYSEKLVVF